MSQSIKAGVWLLRERTPQHQKSVLLVDGPSSNLRWGPLFLLVLAANTAVASFAWFVVGLFMK